MATEQNPSIRNVEAFKNTVVKFCDDNVDKLKHEYTFVFYYAGEDKKIKENDNIYRFSYNMDESVYRTFEKTRLALIDTRLIIKPDLYVRVNISTYINIVLLDTLAEQIYDSDMIICNKINTHINNILSPFFNCVYPRGDFMVFKNDVTDAIVYCGERYMYNNTKMNGIKLGVDHVDDCMIGVCLKDCYGNDYYKKISTVRYNYVPDKQPDYTEIDLMSIASRIKTVPPNKCSGYSWDDNEYRLFDVNKFEGLYDIYKNVEYNNDITLNDVLTDNVYQIVFINDSYLSREEYDTLQKKWSK